MTSTIGKFKCNMTCDNHHTIGSPYHPYGKLNMEITFDEPSMKAYHEWMADGCNGKLILTRDGISYERE